MITPEEMIDEINGVFGSHPGCRALHAKGTLCAGHFTATPEAKALTRAPHMQGDRMEATVRLSNGGGNPHVGDGARDVRGLAVKIYLPDGSRTDLVTQTAPVSPTRTPEEFIELVKVSELKPINAVKLPLFFARHLRAAVRVGQAVGATSPPASYASVPYHGLHAWKWIDSSGGERWVRYTFVPASETGSQKRGKGRDYLREELRERLARASIVFHLEVLIAAPGDDPHDSTAGWKSKERVRVGTLKITGLDETRETQGDIVVFDPSRIPDGIEMSDDPVLRFRSRAYSESVRRRSGVQRPSDYPY